MKVAIMQPYFLPYLGYFSLIKQTDRFILIDTVQFIKQGWIERNRIWKPESEWKYIAVPLTKHHRDTKIKDITINNTSDWKKATFCQLEPYKKSAAFYKDTIDVLTNALALDTDSIVKLNEHVLRVICNYIGINFNSDIFSEMNIEIEKVNASDEWALNICKALGNVKEYWNPPLGAGFYNREKYEKAGIDIRFLKINLREYPQGRSEFQPGLSIVDAMMFNEPEKINKMLDDYELI
ncbi:MAG: WbqC family protein [Clostridiaceae bacterium]